MTEHPCKGMAPAQVLAFERIAINEPPQATAATLKALRDRGLIVRIGTAYIVPIADHHQWCEWCDEQRDDDELEEAESGEWFEGP